MDRLPPFDKIGAQPVPDFQNADPASSNPGSIVNALIFNQLQREGVNLELLAGLTPDSANLFQWTQAVSRGGIWVDELTGTGDLAVASLDAVLPALLRGMRIGAVATAANTVTNPKLRVMNLGSTGASTDFPILNEDGSALSVGYIKAGRRYRFEADGAGNVMITGGLGASDVKAIAVAAQPRNEIAFASTQNWTVPAGITQVFVEEWAGGGGGGGSSGAQGIGTGGGGGEYRRGRFDVTPGQVIGVTVGPGGAGGNGGVGGNGGTTSFGALMSAMGGAGGGFGNNVASGQVTPGGSGGAGGSISFPGVGGGFGQNGTANGIATYASGIGGSSPLGGASPAINVNSAGGPGLSPGGGGNGGCIGNVGGNGANGLIIVRF